MWSNREIYTQLGARGELVEPPCIRFGILLLKLKMDVFFSIATPFGTGYRDKLSFMYIMGYAQNIFSKFICKS